MKALPESFPTLRLFADHIEAKGAFAEAQAAFLSPDPATVAKLAEDLAANRIGVVAHFYMDPEVQGVLTSVRDHWEHIHISDSLVMADRAVEMARAGCRAIVVLGVDFMSENARAMLDAGGFADVPVYRADSAAIGCSLAEAAETKAYGAYLMEARQLGNALHVVYINTSLVTKAKAQNLVPTITCTSSNVVRTILQAAAQVPDVNIFFGPDTYMGQNLATLLETLSESPAEIVRALHPGHTPQSIADLRKRFHFFGQGNCIVHHMFGKEVVATTERDYPNAFVTAHLEVPGEMFELALARQVEGRGVVGSTSNILDFISERVSAATTHTKPVQLEFILGTEAGMITPIVREVQSRLRTTGNAGFVDIVFPVAAEAISATQQGVLPVIPGVSGGEGCSPAGGCATCPYMKMNSLSALQSILAERDPNRLRTHHPRSYSEDVGGRTVVELGTETILAMRHFQRHGKLSEQLVAAIAG